MGDGKMRWRERVIFLYIYYLVIQDEEIQEVLAVLKYKNGGLPGPS